MGIGGQEMTGGREPSEWELEKSEPFAECPVFKTTAKTFRHPDGRVGRFFVNECADWVQAAALFNSPESGELCTILVKQFRFGTRKTSWEFPGGIMETGETPEGAGERELLEETGYGGDKAILAASYSPNPAIQSNLAHFVIVENCRLKSALDWDKNEEILIRSVPVSELDKMIEKGEIYHSLAICSVYFLQKRLLGRA